MALLVFAGTTPGSLWIVPLYVGNADLRSLQGCIGQKRRTKAIPRLCDEARLSTLGVKDRPVEKQLDDQEHYQRQM